MRTHDDKAVAGSVGDDARKLDGVLVLVDRHGCEHQVNVVAPAACLDAGYDRGVEGVRFLGTNVDLGNEADGQRVVAQPCTPDPLSVAERSGSIQNARSRPFRHAGLAPESERNSGRREADGNGNVRENRGFLSESPGHAGLPRLLIRLANYIRRSSAWLARRGGHY